MSLKQQKKKKHVQNFVGIIRNRFFRISKKRQTSKNPKKLATCSWNCRFSHFSTHKGAKHNSHRTCLFRPLVLPFGQQTIKVDSSYNHDLYQHTKFILYAIIVIDNRILCVHLQRKLLQFIYIFS